MTVRQRTDLTTSQKIQCAAAALAGQHAQGAKTALSAVYGIDVIPCDNLNLLNLQRIKGMKSPFLTPVPHPENCYRMDTNGANMGTVAHLGPVR